MAATSVKYMHSGMVNAPSLSGTPGSFIALLDACLVNGWGLKTVDSLVVAGGIATMNISTGHSFEVGTVADVIGATVSGGSVNGQQRITAAAAGSVSFAAPGISNQTATGTITTKVAGAGWGKPFSATNLAVYKSQDPTSFGCLLRVDDTHATDVRVAGYESMSDVDSGINRFPSSGQIGGAGLYWPKSFEANGTSRGWAIVADERTFYYWCAPSVPTSITSQGLHFGFGDLIPQASTDDFACVLIGGSSSRNMAGDDAPTLMTMGVYNNSPVQMMQFAPRPYNGLGTSAQVTGITNEARMCLLAAAASGAAQMAYPNRTDNGLFLSRVIVTEDSSVRGRWPGVLHTPQNVAFAFSTRDIIPGADDLAGRRLVALRGGSPIYQTQNSPNGAYGCVFFDTTGPWR